jgi:glycosyltransferase involved in cell wall biosynthesis
VMVLSSFQFNIVHLSTSHTGGAGIAARRLNEGLVDAGVQSKFFAIAQPSFNPKSEEYSIDRSSFTKIIGGLLSKLQGRVSQDTFFSILSGSSGCLAQVTKFATPSETIFHVHNYFNLLSASDVREILEQGYKIVFTLHDQRLMTAGCHYSINCDNFKKVCSGCPIAPFYLSKIIEKNLTQFLFLKKYSNQVKIIAPSDWIRNLAEDSTVLSGLQILKVSNYLPTNMKIENYQLRKRQQNEKIRVGVASMNPHSYIKGGAVVQELKLNAGNFMQLIFMSEISDELVERKFWQEIDFLLVPSIIDNSPNVIHEAKIRKIPVIATQVGGITELIDPEFDIEITQNMKSSEIVQSISEYIKRLDEGYVQLRKKSGVRYQNLIGDPVQDHIQIYKSFISDN